MGCFPHVEDCLVWAWKAPVCLGFGAATGWEKGVFPLNGVG
jgi:hypothetical protein